MVEQKRHALVAALVFQQRAHAYDDGAEMLIRKVRKIHNRAKEAAPEHTDEERGAFYEPRADASGCGARLPESDGSNEERLGAIDALIGPAVDDLVRRCDEHIASASRSHLHLLPQFFRHPRTAFMLLLERTASDLDRRRTSVSKTQYGSFWRIKTTMRNTVLITREPHGQNGMGRTEPLLDLSFVPDVWWTLVTGLKSRATTPHHVDRRFLELCVVSVVADELQASDLCIAAGNKVPGLRPAVDLVA